MAAQPQPDDISVEAYLERDRHSADLRYELLDGRIWLMAGGTANHSILCSNLNRLLSQQLLASDCVVHTADMRVQVAATRYFYPDLTISCHPADRGTTDMLRHPRLVAEVLSPSTAALDRGRKAMAYRACSSLEWYVLIESTQPFVEVQHRLGAGWDLVTYDLPEQNITLTGLDISFSVADLYHKVQLEPVRESPD